MASSPSAVPPPPRSLKPATPTSPVLTPSSTGSNGSAVSSTAGGGGGGGSTSASASSTPNGALSRSSPLDWTVADVGTWLTQEGKGLEEYVAAFKMHRVDGPALLALTPSDLKDIGVRWVGDIKRLSAAIDRARFRAQLPALHHKDAGAGDCAPVVAVPPSLAPDAATVGLAPVPDLPALHRSASFSFPTPAEVLVRSHATPTPVNTDDLAEFTPSLMAKAVMAFVYFWFAVFCSSITMVAVHERVPDQKSYPPLPDIILDNVPRIPAAFALTEIIGLILFIALTILLILHKHRLIIVRRAFSITGSLLLLRCCTMFATSLSVPGLHLDCKASFGDTVQDKLARAWAIASGFGMTVAGVQTCGDYMFSGHTVAVTMLCFCLTEYTPSTWGTFHTGVKILNIFGMFFILAGHEHYSVDVLVAFYLTTRLAMYYHSLAALHAATGHMAAQMWSWYPMFSYLENAVTGPTPNELGHPWAAIRDWLIQQKLAIFHVRRPRAASKRIKNQ